MRERSVSGQFQIIQYTHWTLNMLRKTRIATWPNPSFGMFIVIGACFIACLESIFNLWSAWMHIDFHFLDIYWVVLNSFLKYKFNDVYHRRFILTLVQQRDTLHWWKQSDDWWHAQLIHTLYLWLVAAVTFCLLSSTPSAPALRVDLSSLSWKLQAFTISY
jgi:hypothetical protein